MHYWTFLISVIYLSTERANNSMGGHYYLFLICSYKLHYSPLSGGDSIFTPLLPSSGDSVESLSCSLVMIPATIFTFPFFFFLILHSFCFNYPMICYSLWACNISMILGPTIGAKPYIILNSHILTIICMFIGSSSTGSTFSWNHWWVSHIWAVHVERVRLSTTLTVILSDRVFSYFSPLQESRSHAIICKVSHAILDNVSQLITPSTGADPWVWICAIWTLWPQIILWNCRLIRILGL